MNEKTWGRVSGEGGGGERAYIRDFVVYQTWICLQISMEGFLYSLFLKTQVKYKLEKIY